MLFYEYEVYKPYPDSKSNQFIVKLEMLNFK